jgi:hypothetical protein
MRNLTTRVERLESKQPADDVAARLGGFAVAKHVEGGLVEIAGGEIITEAELEKRLAGATGRLLFLDLE